MDEVQARGEEDKGAEVSGGEVAVRSPNKQEKSRKKVIVTELSCVLVGERSFEKRGGGTSCSGLTSEAGTSAWSTSLRTLAAALHDTWLKIWLRRGAATELPTERVSLASSRGRGVTRVMVGSRGGGG